MKIKASEAIKDLAGKDIKNGEEAFTVGNAISNILLSAKEGGKMKMFVLAQKFHTDKVVEVDDADLNLVKKAIETADMYTNLVTGQLLVILSKEDK